MRTKPWKIGVSLVGGLLVVWWVAPFGNSRRPDRCLVAQGYAGWLIIEHGVKSAPATQVVDGHNLYRFPPKGRIKTSTPIASGFATDEYYYVTPKGLVKIPDSDAPGKNAGSGPMVWAAKGFLIQSMLLLVQRANTTKRIGDHRPSLRSRKCETRQSKQRIELMRRTRKRRADHDNTPGLSVEDGRAFCRCCRGLGV